MCNRPNPIFSSRASPTAISGEGVFFRGSTDKPLSFTRLVGYRPGFFITSFSELKSHRTGFPEISVGLAGTACTDLNAPCTVYISSTAKYINIRQHTYILHHLKNLMEVSFLFAITAWFMFPWLPGHERDRCERGRSIHAIAYPKHDSVLRHHFSSGCGFRSGWRGHEKADGDYRTCTSNSLREK